MPAVKLTVFKYHAFFISSIALDGKIISPYSCYAKKGLIYIVIIKPSNCQPFSYFKYTKLNTCVLYNIYSVSFNKYTFLTCFNSR